MTEDEKRVICHPRNLPAAHKEAARLGLSVQVHDYVPPGTIYVLDPAALFDPTEPNPGAAGKIEGV